MRHLNKLHVQDVLEISKPSMHSDGGGLYLRVRASGARSSSHDLLSAGMLQMQQKRVLPLVQSHQRTQFIRDFLLKNIDFP